MLVGVAGDQGEPRVLRHDTDRELIQRVLDIDTVFVGHNLGFDMAFLEHAGYRIPPPERWDDTVAGRARRPASASRGRPGCGS